MPPDPQSLPRQGSRVGWDEVHAAHRDRQAVRVTLQDRTFEGPVTMIEDASFEVLTKDARTTFLWSIVDAVEVLA